MNMSEAEEERLGWPALVMGVFLSVFVGVSMILFLLFLSEFENHGLNKRGNQRLSNVFLKQVQRKLFLISYKFKHIFFFFA